MAMDAHHYQIYLPLWESVRVYQDVVRGAAEYFCEKETWDDCSKSIETEWPRVDGAIISASSPKPVEFWGRTQAVVVNFSNALFERPFPSVVNDDVAVGSMAAEFFLDRDYRHFLFYASNTARYVHERLSGFAGRIQEAGLRHHEIHGSAMLDERFRDLPTPLAVFAAEDSAALHVLTISAELGRTLPGDVAVLGVNNDDIMCRVAKPPLSSIQLGSAKVGYEAARLLDHLLQNPKFQHEELRIPPKGVEERLSTSASGHENPVIARVANLMLGNVRRPLSIDEIAFRLGMTRKRIEREFRRELDSTPARFFQQYRIDFAKRLLRRSDLPIATVAEQCGFPDYTRFSKVFSREVGQPPGAWRREVTTK